MKLFLLSAIVFMILLSGCIDTVKNITVVPECPKIMFSCCWVDDKNITRETGEGPYQNDIRGGSFKLAEDSNYIAIDNTWGWAGHCHKGSTSGENINYHYCEFDYLVRKNAPDGTILSYYDGKISLVINENRPEKYYEIIDQKCKITKTY